MIGAAADALTTALAAYWPALGALALVASIVIVTSHPHAGRGRTDAR
jgi:hypothetical protein